MAPSSRGRMSRRTMSQEHLETIARMKGEGASPKEIAEKIGFSLGAVKKRLYGRSDSGGRSLMEDVEEGITPPSTEPPPPRVDPAPVMAAPVASAPAAPAVAPEEWDQGSGDMFPDPVRDFAAIVAQICGEIGIPKDMVRFIYKSVHRTPMYHDRNGLFNFLNSLKGVGGEKANVICDQVFSGLASRQQQGGYQQHGGHYPGQSPLLPPGGQRGPYPQGPPGFPPPPGYPPAPGYPPSPGYYPPYYPPQPPPTQRDPDMMTKEDFERALEKRVDSIRRDDGVKERFDSLEGAIRKMATTMQEGGQYVYEPVIGANGDVVLNPETKEIAMRRIPISNVNPQASMESQLVTVLSSALDKVAAHGNQPAPTGMSEDERRLMAAQQKNQILELQGNLGTQISAIVTQNKLLQQQVTRQSNAGLSEDGHVAVAEIQQRGKVLETGMNGINTAVSGILKIFEKAMQVEAHPAGYDDVPQWSNKELEQTQRSVNAYLKQD